MDRDAETVYASHVECAEGYSIMNAVGLASTTSAVDGNAPAAGSHAVTTAVDAAASPAASNAVRKAADHFPWDLLIPILPQLLGLLLVTAFLFFFGRRRIGSMLRRIRKIGFAGFEVELAGDLDNLAASKDRPMTGRQASRTARLLEDNMELLSCARLLWLDDEPPNNSQEIKILRRLCVQIDLARSAAEVSESLERAVYDIIISGMHSKGELESALSKSPLPPALIFYVREEGKTPSDAFGLASRPDQFFRLIVQAMRCRKA
jgi:hypothetical protein